MGNYKAHCKLKCCILLCYNFLRETAKKWVISENKDRFEVEGLNRVNDWWWLGSVRQELVSPCRERIGG